MNKVYLILKGNNWYLKTARFQKKSDRIYGGECVFIFGSKSLISLDKHTKLKLIEKKLEKRLDNVLKRDILYLTRTREV